MPSLLRGVRTRELVEQAKRAAQAGFHALWISDHYHPEMIQQGTARSSGRCSGAVLEVTHLAEAHVRLEMLEKAVAVMRTARVFSEYDRG